MIKRSERYLIGDLAASEGGNESQRMYAITNLRTGKTNVVVEYTFSARFPVEKIEEADRLYERLYEIRPTMQDTMPYPKPPIAQEPTHGE